MQKKLLVLNWKSNKTSQEGLEFIKSTEGFIQQLTQQYDFIICPSFTALSALSEYIKTNSLPIFLGAQNISGYGQGAYTGEVHASQIKEFCDNVIIGHSERRRYQHESLQDIAQKIKEANSVGLKSIVCIQEPHESVEKDVFAIAYEPPTAISTFGVGKAEAPGDINSVFKTIRKRTNAFLLYGGSVSGENMKQYLAESEIQGLLIGKAGLDSNLFKILL